MEQGKALVLVATCCALLRNPFFGSCFHGKTHFNHGLKSAWASVFGGCAGRLGLRVVWKGREAKQNALWGKCAVYFGIAILGGRDIENQMKPLRLCAVLVFLVALHSLQAQQAAHTLTAQSATRTVLNGHKTSKRRRSGRLCST